MLLSPDVGVNLGYFIITLITLSRNVQIYPKTEQKSSTSELKMS